MTAKLDFIVGRSGTGKSRHCLDAICAAIREAPLGDPLVLLVPEHMTYKMERLLAESLPGNGQGFMRAVVFGFRRFARQVLLETGGAGLPRISDVGRQLLLRKLLLKHQQEGDLTIFARAARQRGFTDSLSGMIKELKSYRLPTDLLRETAEGLGKGRLSGKLTEIARLVDDFQEEMEGRANDSEDLMALLAAKIPQSTTLKGAEIWVDGFTFFNPQELEVMGALLGSAAAVHVTLPLGGQNLSGGAVNLKVPENELETGMFHRSYQTLAALKNLWCELGGGSFGVTLLEENQRARNHVLSFLEQHLFATGEGKCKESKGLRLVEAANRRLEVEVLAADILRLARKGWRYRDIGVLVRDGEVYDSLLQLVFQEYGIPYFYDGKRPSIHHPLAELLRSALETVRLGWRYESVFRCLRTGFFPCVRDDVDKLENYVLEFGIRGKGRWTQERNWDWHRSRSLEEEELEEKAQERLLHIDGLRRLAALPLLNLGKALNGAANVRDMTAALYDFLLELQVPQRLAEWEEVAEAEGRLADAAEHRQIWESCMELFDQLVEISGEEVMDLRDYETVLSAGLDALKISLIPPGLDYVNIASFDQNSLDNIPALYILGANAGIMPRRSKEQGLLTDADRIHIADAFEKRAEAGKGHFDISRGSQERSFGERFLLYRGFSEAREYLWVSYALADSDGSGLQPASLVQRLRKIFPQAEFISIPLETVERNDEFLLSAPGPALSGLASALRGQKELGNMQPFWQDVYNWAREQPGLAAGLNLALSGLFARGRAEFLPPELARLLFLSGSRLRGSVTRFELFSKCPFAHFATYGLKLQERREYKFRALDLGQLLHAVLSSYGQKVGAEYNHEWGAVPEARRIEICHELIEELAPRLQSEVLLSRDNYRHLKRRLQATAERAVNQLTAWAALSKFRPVFFEEHFGGAGDRVQLKPLPLKDGYTLSFKGQIDRLDVRTDAPYYLVIDYKTGQAAINVFEVYYGLRLQLLAYLLVARELLAQQGEQRLPAGMLYAFLQNPLIRGRDTEKGKLSEEVLQRKVQKRLRMPGWVLADRDIIEALEAGAQGEYIFASVKEGEEETSFVPPDSVKTPQEFELLLAYVEYILKETGDRILAGEIAARPYRLKNKQVETACTYCRFKDVCGFDANLPGCSYRELRPQEAVVLEEEMAKLMGREDWNDAIY